MKEIINIAILLIALLGGAMTLKEIHGMVRKAALEKAAQRLPSLVDLNKSLRMPSKKITVPVSPIENGVHETCIEGYTKSPIKYNRHTRR